MRKRNGGVAAESLASTRGAVILEAALTLPIIVPLFMAIVQYGMIENTHVTLRNAAGFTARQLTVGGTDLDMSTASATAKRMADESVKPMLDPNLLSADVQQVDITYTSGGGSGSGNSGSGSQASSSSSSSSSGNGNGNGNGGSGNGNGNGNGKNSSSSSSSSSTGTGSGSSSSSSGGGSTVVVPKAARVQLTYQLPLFFPVVVPFHNSDGTLTVTAVAYMK